MFGLQLFLKRRRRVLIRYSAVALAGLTVVAVALPRADAHDAHKQTAAANGHLALLLSPQPMASQQFAMFYGLPHS